MIDLKKFNRRKREVERLRKDKQRNEGALEQLMKQIQKEFNCQTLAEVEQKLKEMEIAKRKKKKKFQEGFAAFEKKYKQFTQELSNQEEPKKAD